MPTTHKQKYGFLCLLGLALILTSCQTPVRDEVSPAPFRPPIARDTQIPHWDLAKLENLIYQGINRERTQTGLDPLEDDQPLGTIARAHSQDMAAHMFFSHTNLKRESFDQRANLAGYSCRRPDDPYKSQFLAENIFDANAYDTIHSNGVSLQYHWRSIEEIAASVVKGWMESPPHRANILHPNLKRSGIGAAVSSNQDIFITLDFCGN